MPSTDLLYPDGPDDHEGILRYAEGAIELQRHTHLEHERLAQRNILYWLGKQWIKLDPFVGWRPLALKKTTPRPVTNKIAPLVNQAVSNLVAFRPPITYSPVTDSPDDVAAAGVADRINQIIEREANVRLLKPYIAKFFVLTGNVFLVNSYDTGPDSGTTFIQAYQCPHCATQVMPAQLQESGSMCPECGIQGPFQEAVDEMGQPAGQEYPRGRHYTEIESVFSCWYDPAAQMLDDSPYFIVSKLRDENWVAKMYGAEFAESVAYDQEGDSRANLWESLAYTVAGGDTSIASSPTRGTKRTRVRRIWVKLRKDKAPGGIYAEQVGDRIVMAQEWPYKDDRGDPMLNVVHIGYDNVPGRLAHKTRVDDLVPKQDQRNRLESILELHSTRMANSVWLIPEGVGVSKVSGEQGQILRYNALAGVPPPQRVTGDSISPYIINWIAMIDQEMDAIFGLYEVGRGEAPKGVPSYAAMQLLDERQQQGQAAPMENWAMGWLRWSKQHLNIWRQFATEDRTMAIGAGRWSVSKFNKASLQGMVDMDVEIGQNRPHTSIGRRAAIGQATQLGFILPMDPFERYKGLEALGIPELMPDYKVDLEKASRTIDRLINGEMPQPPMPWENHMIAISVFRRFMLSEDFESLPPETQQAIMSYTAIHFALIQQQQAQLGPGQIAHAGRGTESKGREDNTSPDQKQLDTETQNASPDDMNAAPRGVVG